MKLNTAQRRHIEEQLGVEAVPEEHPVTPDLKEAFGDHTFFLDSAGLNIVEPDASPEPSKGKVVKLATWGSEECTELLGHEPEVLPVTVDIERDESDDPT
jgi:hypothetical protein